MPFRHIHRTQPQSQPPRDQREPDSDGHDVDSGKAQRVACKGNGHHAHEDDDELRARQRTAPQTRDHVRKEEHAHRKSRRTQPRREPVRKRRAKQQIARQVKQDYGQHAEIHVVAPLEIGRVPTRRHAGGVAQGRVVGVGQPRERIRRYIIEEKLSVRERLRQLEILAFRRAIHAQIGAAQPGIGHNEDARRRAEREIQALARGNAAQGRGRAHDKDAQGDEREGKKALQVEIERNGLIERDGRAPRAVGIKGDAYARRVPRRVQAHDALRVLVACGVRASQRDAALRLVERMPLVAQLDFHLHIAFCRIRETYGLQLRAFCQLESVAALVL